MEYWPSSPCPRLKRTRSLPLIGPLAILCLLASCGAEAKKEPPIAGGTDGQTSEGSSSPGSAKVNGTIKRTCDGTPIAGIRLVLADAGTDKAVTPIVETGSDGTYSFSSVPSGTYKTLVTECPNEPNAATVAIGEAFVLDASTSPFNLNFELSPKVVDAETQVCGADLDCDSYVDKNAGGTDCDDQRKEIHPGAPEELPGTDADCDGVTLAFNNPTYGFTRITNDGRTLYSLNKNDHVSILGNPYERAVSGIPDKSLSIPNVCGLASEGGDLWVATSIQGDYKIKKISSDGNAALEFDYPSDYSSGCGLAFENTSNRLWLAGTAERGIRLGDKPLRLWALNPSDGQVLKQCDVTGVTIEQTGTDAAWDGAALWVIGSKVTQVGATSAQTTSPLVKISTGCTKLGRADFITGGFAGTVGITFFKTPTGVEAWFATQVTYTTATAFWRVVP